LFCNAGVEPYIITADWHSILIAADNKEKIEEGGPLRKYVRGLECTDNCSSITIKFYLKFHGVCFIFESVAQKKGEVYHTRYMGENIIKFIRISDRTIVFCLENFDGVKTTKLTQLLGSKDGNLSSDTRSQPQGAYNTTLYPF
ncbi:hypothetical protein FD754_025363, partial [Muntiacus muntjak]